MGQPISEAKKAIFLQRAEARLNFARNLPAEDPNRDAKIREAEKGAADCTRLQDRPRQDRRRPQGGQGEEEACTMRAAFKTARFRH